MKLTNVILAFAILLAFASCKDEDSTISGPDSVELSYDISKSCNVTFTSSDPWIISSSNNVTVSPSSGNAGTCVVSVKARNYNCTNEESSTNFTIKSAKDNTSKVVNVIQKPAFVVDSVYHEVSPEGDKIEVLFNTDIDLGQNFGLYYDTTTKFADMCASYSNYSSNTSGLAMINGAELKCTHADVTRSEDSKYEWKFSITIDSNDSETARSGVLYLGLLNNKNVHSAAITLHQSALTNSVNGKVSTLLAHTKGNGVPVIVMGDGFLRSDIVDGTYRKAMQQACDYLFTVQPMQALRDYFDVYEVTAISKDSTFSDGSSTAFSSQFAGGSSTEITGDDEKAVLYAEKAINDSLINDALIIIVINDTRYAGTCSMYGNNVKSDIPGGYSIAYIPMTIETSSTHGVSFEQVLHHEAIGHGFAKLADEYYYQSQGTIPNSEKLELMQWQEYGQMRNVSVYSDVTKTYWAAFAADERYASENISCYQGGDTYYKGVYRSTKTSIMDDNVGAFNAISRLMIYKRCMKIALGSAWNYDYETFVKFDQANSSSSSSGAKSAYFSTTSSHAVRPLGRPRMHIYNR